MTNDEIPHKHPRIDGSDDDYEKKMWHEAKRYIKEKNDAISLSDKKINIGCREFDDFVYPEKDVKESVQKLKDEFEHDICTCFEINPCPFCRFKREIDKIFGNQLTESALI